VAAVCGQVNQHATKLLGALGDPGPEVVVMARRVDQAIERAHFAVREVTNSRISSDAVRQAEELRAQQLRDMAGSPTTRTRR